MKRITKHIITITVYILVILYFLIFFKAFGNGKNKICNNFDSVLSSRIEQYFANSLPENDGETSKVSVSELIAQGYLTLTDLQETGTTCSGEAYVSKANEKYYYYNNITCGICSSDEMYTAWSDWTETLPNFGNKKYQVMVKALYNYSNSDKKYSDWTEWGEDESKLKAPSIPDGATIADKEYENKTQYKYRDKEYQWYKIDSKVEYYNNGAFYETAPASGYVKDDSTKKVSDQSNLYRTKAALKQAEPRFPDSSIKQVKGYALKIAKYIYSYEKPGDSIESTYFAASSSAAVSKCQVDGYVNCKATSKVNTTWNKKQYNCVPKGYAYGAATAQTVSTDCSSQVSNPPCSSSSNVGNTQVTCTPSKWTPTISSCQYGYFYGNSQTGSTTLKKSGSSLVYYSGDKFSTTTNNLFSGFECRTNSPSCSSSSDAGNEKITSCQITMIRCLFSDDGHGGCYGSSYYHGNDGNCTANFYDRDTCPARDVQNYGARIVRATFQLTYQVCGTSTSLVTSTGSEVSSCSTSSAPNCSSNPTGSAITACTPSKWTKTTRTCSANTYGWSTEYTSSNGLSTCSASEPSCSTSSDSSHVKITCDKVNTTVYGYTGNEKSKTYYLKADGTYTDNISNAAHLSESEYNALKKKDSSLSVYKKTGSPVYDSSNSRLMEGDCPSGNYECLTLYKAVIYSYKWYKNTSTSKIPCNNSNYSATSPAAGCIKDEDKMRLGDWSQYQDKKPQEADYREINERKLLRYRIIYTNTNSVELSEWLPLSEFEERMGKTIGDLLKNPSITVREKILYKYRIKK